MRLTRDLPLAAALVVVAFSLFAGGGVADGSLPWLGAGALAAILAGLAVVGVPGGLSRLVPLAALAGWSAITIAWSTLPDRSWDYANRGLVYLLFALLGLWLADRRRELALGLAALLGAVAVWSLAGVVLPGLNGDFTRNARLIAPVGLWNQLALLGDFALPLALWVAGRRRLAGTLLAYLWVVVLVLTLSRGGVAVAVVAVLAWLALSGEAADGLATLIAAAVPAGVVAGLAFTLRGVTTAGMPHGTRWHDGLVFGALLVAGAAVAAGLARVPRPEVTPRLRRLALGLGLLLVVALVVLGAFKARSAWHQFTTETGVSNTGGRFTTAGSNFRWVWWQQAWHGFTAHPGGGTGAGTFTLTNRLYRQSSLDSVTEPHDLPVQLLSEAGIVGGLLVVLAFAALVAPLRRRAGHELALALVLPLYFLHALVDIDWDFVAVTGPALLVAGSLVGRPAVRRVSSFAVLAAAGAALAVFVCLLLPWLGHRWSNQALGEVNTARAIRLADRARSVDPLLVDPIRIEADDLQVSDPRRALALYALATRKQPANPDLWLAKGLFELDYGCPRLAYPDLQIFTNLDDHADPRTGAIYKDRALKYVNSGKPDPAFCGD